ncbi:MAG: creatininase family protein [Candidatus Aenigmatarchaeota archaeon]
MLILNGHSTNIWPLKCAWDALRFKFSNIQVKVINWWDLLANEEKELLFKDGGHANVTETSIALALEPELVHMEKAIDETTQSYSFDYRVDQISKTGVLGKPSLANAEYGKKILNKVIENAIAFTKKALEEEIPYP